MVEGTQAGAAILGMITTEAILITGGVNMDLIKIFESAIYIKIKNSRLLNQ